MRTTCVVAGCGNGFGAGHELYQVSGPGEPFAGVCVEHFDGPNEVVAGRAARLKPEAIGVVAQVAAAVASHVFVTPTRCWCGHGPRDVREWREHQAAVAVAAVAEWLQELTSSTLQADPHETAAGWAARRLVACVPDGLKVHTDFAG